MKIKTALITALAMMTAVEAHAGTRNLPPRGEPYVITAADAMGGSIRKRSRHILALNANGNPIEIRRNIKSSGTFYLGADNVCVDPGIKARFHGPMNTVPAILSTAVTFVPMNDFLSRNKRLEIVGIMGRIYGDRFPKLKTWFYESGAYRLYGVRYKIKTGQELHDEFDVPLCDGEG